MLLRKAGTCILTKWPKEPGHKPKHIITATMLNYIRSIELLMEFYQTSDEALTLNEDLRVKIEDIPKIKLRLKRQLTT